MVSITLNDACIHAIFQFVRKVQENPVLAASTVLRHVCEGGFSPVVFLGFQLQNLPLLFRVEALGMLA